MDLQIPHVSKVLPTLVANKRLLLRMSLDVAGKVVLKSETFPTLLARERFLSGVCLLVALQVAGCSECFPALGALEWLFARMNPFMDSEVAGISADFTAEAAAVGFISRGVRVNLGRAPLFTPCTRVTRSRRDFELLYL